MKNIGLFGGTFDPIHNGHLHIARAFADEIGLDTVVFLPAGDPYHKNPSRACVQDRLIMTELAIVDDPRFRGGSYCWRTHAPPAPSILARADRFSESKIGGFSAQTQVK